MNVRPANSRPGGDAVDLRRRMLHQTPLSLEMEKAPVKRPIRPVAVPDRVVGAGLSLTERQPGFVTYTLPAVNAEVLQERPAPLDTLDDFDAVYEAYYQSVYRTVRAIVLDGSQAEDVTQDTFVKAYRHRQDYQPTGSLGGWLHKIAVRKAISSLRWRGVQDRLVKAIKLQTPSTHEDWTLSVQLTNLLKQLSPGTRAAVALHYFHGYRYREIATMLDIPDGTVATRIANGLRQMRKLINATEETSQSKR